MKTHRQIVLISLALSLFTFTTNSFAGGSGTQIITNIEVNSEGFVSLWAGNWKNPDVCSSSEYIVLKPDNGAYSEMYALLMASYLQGKRISATIKGCYSIDAETFPILTTNLKSL